MGFDLGDAFDRAFNVGKYGKFKHKGSTMDNLNPFGKSFGENMADTLNPIGEKNERTGEFINKGDSVGGSLALTADNPLGQSFERGALAKGKTSEQAMEEGAGATAGTAAAVVAALFGGGAFAGGGEAGGAAGGGTASVAESPTIASGASEASTFDKIYGGVENISTVNDLFGGSSNQGYDEGYSTYNETEKEEERARKRNKKKRSDYNGIYG